MTPLKVMNDLVLIELEEVEDYHKRKGFDSIVLPDAYRVGPDDPPVWGKIVAIGPRVPIKNPSLTLSSRVMVGKFSGARFTHEGKEHFLVREYDVLVKDGP